MNRDCPCGSTLHGFQRRPAGSNGDLDRQTVQHFADFLEPFRILFRQGHDHLVDFVRGDPILAYRPDTDIVWDT